MVKVVYVDDEADTEAMASRFEDLDDLGVTVIPIHSVGECMERLADIAPTTDVLVLDQIMPPMGRYSLEETTGGTTTGLALLREIRRAYPKLPVIVVSVSEVPLPSTMQQLGIIAFFRKPVCDLGALASAIRQAARR